MAVAAGKPKVLDSVPTAKWQNGTQAKELKYISKRRKKQTRTFASVDQKPKPENLTNFAVVVVVAMATSLL